MVKYIVVTTMEDETSSILQHIIFSHNMSYYVRLYVFERFMFSFHSSPISMFFK